MTLVFRSPKLVETINNQNPGPGAYKIKEISPKDMHPSASFLSKVDRQNIHIEETDLGPSSYFKETYSTMNKGEGFQSVFKSKIERFRNDEEAGRQSSKEREFAKEFNELMKKEKSQHPYKGKLIDLKLKKSKEEKLNDIQCLPSIPSQQHSYGYRVDYNTKKLVNNYNPKVIFTQNLKSNEKDDYYFQRSHNSLGNTKKCLINTSAKRSVNQLAHQISNPSFNTYNAGKYNTIEEQAKKAKNTNNFHSSLGRFHESSPSKKQLLKLNRLKRDFKMYIDDKIDLSQLENAKFQTNQAQKSPKKVIENRTECFLTKQSRFQMNFQENFANKPQNKSPIKILKTQNSSSLQRNSITQQTEKRKQPFDLGVQRFQPRHKELLGPGTYQLKQQTFKHGVNLKQNEERFKTHQNTNEIPGPGSYDVNKDTHTKQKMRCPFSKHRNNDYFNDIKRHKSRQHSMEDLYQQVGKHMNYLNKIQKIDSKLKQNRQQNIKKYDNMPNLDRMSQAKKFLQEKLELENQQMAIEKENRNQEDFRNMKYHHLYGYNKPIEKVSDLGPGCYEIRTNLNKKTFNKTVNA